MLRKTLNEEEDVRCRRENVRIMMMKIKKERKEGQKQRKIHRK
jgi:hypothetical protein